MARNVVVAIMDENKQELVTHKVDYGTKLLVKTGDKVARGDKLFEWDPPYTPANHCSAKRVPPFPSGVVPLALRALITNWEKPSWACRVGLPFPPLLRFETRGFCG